MEDLCLINSCRIKILTRIEAALTTKIYKKKKCRRWFADSNANKQPSKTHTPSTQWFKTCLMRQPRCRATNSRWEWWMTMVKKWWIIRCRICSCTRWGVSRCLCSKSRWRQAASQSIKTRKKTRRKRRKIKSDRPQRIRKLTMKKKNIASNNNWLPRNTKTSSSTFHSLKTKEARVTMLHLSATCRRAQASPAAQRTPAKRRKTVKKTKRRRKRSLNWPLRQWVTSSN